MEEVPDEKLKRGKGRGSSFFALGDDVLKQLWSVPTTNRLNLVLTYLVLLAGTGSDHQLTKWSARSCEEYLGIGKPRAKAAIDELIAAGLITRTETSTRMMPQYRLPPLPRDEDPVFMPMQLVTGFRQETPILRRIREHGDPLLLRMLLDLYGLISLDATHGIPLANLRGGLQTAGPTARKVAEMGYHAVWAFDEGEQISAAGTWTTAHYEKGGREWKAFWERLRMLRQIGAIYDEAWVFDGDTDDAEPLMPLDPSGFYAVAQPTREAELTFRTLEVCRELVGPDRSYVFEMGQRYFMALPLHQKAPAFRLVTRLRAQADTPGSRLAWKRRQDLIEARFFTLDQLGQNARDAQFGRPVRLRARAGAA